MRATPLAIILGLGALIVIVAVPVLGRYAPVEPKKCLSSEACPAGQYCTTEDGDCESACPPDAEACIQACAGFCRAIGSRSSVRPSIVACFDEKQSFERVLRQNASCERDTDCMIFTQSCPYITCGEAIAVGAEVLAQAAADAFAECEEQSGKPVACAACVEMTARCEAGLCRAIQMRP